MRVGYMTNHYPQTRHTFIRREIAGLEGHGVEVRRYSIRPAPNDLVDPADLRERDLTRPLLAAKGAVVRAALGTMFSRPLKFLKALRRAWRLGSNIRRGRLKHLAYLAEACLLRRWLRDDGVRHLHVHFATNPAAVALLCRDLGGPAYSITVHGPEEWDRPEALSLAEKYSEAEFVAAVTDFGRCQALRWLPLRHWEKVVVVRCGVDESWLSRTPTPVPDVPNLLSVAALTEQKGHLMIIRALELVMKRGLDFRMTFVGDGPLRPVIEQEIRGRGLSQRVTLAGWRSGAEVREFLEGSRALVMPSFAENLPVAMMEAFSAGRPVLGTYIAGVPELVEPGRSGWLVPAGNPELAADAIGEILAASPDDLSRMGLHGRRAVERLHSAAREAGKMRDLFAARPALADPPPGP